MGRGRAKAKQTKVARELKYRSVDTDFTSLERELREGSGYGFGYNTEVADEDYEIDEEYSDLAKRYEQYLDDGEDQTV